MFISTKQLTRILERIDELERQVRVLQRRTGVYVDDGGLLQGWEGNCPSIVEAVNALATAQKFKWKQVYAQRIQPPDA